MSELDKFVIEIEAKEAAEDMHFSVYYIPPEWQTEESPYEY